MVTFKTPLTAYDSAIAELGQSPNNPALQHQAVLALARAGSLDFAWAEYKRYGLDEIGFLQDKKLFEDILGLGGRLFKDLFHLTSGTEARDHALNSSEKYETAFKETGGFYSGINAATMALMADMPDEIVVDRVNEILRLLPPPVTSDKETLYFIEATRSEALLLRGETYEARAALRAAVQHDPQNYVAHASTLRQFKMILNKRGETKAWLSSFEPPKPAHYAGHIFADESQSSKIIASGNVPQDKLKIEISDAIQSNDIGFGFGSLAAGSDILIAEVLKDEGCALHVTLPVSPELFIAKSVEPFGSGWVKRFQTCWDVAASQTIVTQSSSWPNVEIDRFSGTVAMGMAASHATKFSIEPLQLLIWDGEAGVKGTSQNAADWAATNRKSIIIPYTGQRQPEEEAHNDAENITLRAIICRADSDEVLEFSSLSKALGHAFKSQKLYKYQARLGLDIKVGNSDEISPETAQRLAAQAVPGSILASEAVTSFLSLNHAGKFSASYMGTLGGAKGSVRTFAVKYKA